MKKKIIIALMVMCAVSLAGCGSKKKEKAPEYEPTYYTSEEELPENQFYIAHTETNDDGEERTIYYNLSTAESTISEANTTACGSDNSRMLFLGYQTTEKLVPTFYEGDKLIYKSKTNIPLSYSFEKFFDNGCSLGVTGLYMDASGNYRYDSSNCRVVEFSDASGLASISADSIYFTAVTKLDEDGNAEDDPLRIDTTRVNTNGVVSGLDAGSTYTCDFRTGTEKITVNMTANVRMLSSAETYMSSRFEFITDYIAEIEMPEYLTSGYYTINNNGIFRFVAKGKSLDDLTEKDYNETIYKYDDNGNIVGTTNGYYFAEDNSLIKGTPVTENDSLDSIVTDDDGNYIGTFSVVKVADPITYSDHKAYKISMQDTLDSTKIISVLYNAKSSETPPAENEIYAVVYKPSLQADVQYEIVSMEKM